jgi:ABC-type antimicrobial peptide transport system permease subunit
LIGMALGLTAGALMVRAVRMLLFEVQPSDPVVFALVAGVLGATAFVACIIPAVRATRVDPLVALRTE